MPAARQACVNQHAACPRRPARLQYDLEGLWGEPGGRNITRVAPKQTVHTLSTLRATA